MEDAYGRTSAAVTSCCWGRFGLAALWRRLRRMSWTHRRFRTYVLGAGAGGLNYDPLRYAQNFDDGEVCECEPDFLTRYAAARRAGLQLQGAVASSGDY
ncbi:unnamed protein product [Urochloa decumbens]|uniref:Uncharacterized protein n=1 Tax=Urochloa decumbens TaxID=240449 RepID=A0ABC9EHE3_9POAL